MSGITFPTRPFPSANGYVPRPGTPRRAVSCHCENPLHIAENDECVTCGHLKQSVIDATWFARARQLAARQERRRLKAAA